MANDYISQITLPNNTTYDIAAISSKVLANYFGTHGVAESTGSTSNRPTTVNIDHTTNGGIIHFKATSKASDKPGEGSILHFNWDTASAWDSQLYIPNGTSWSMQYRVSTSGTNGAWDNWRTLLDSNNYSSYALPSDTVVNQVSQSNTAVNGWRKILLHHTYDSTSTAAVTGEVNVVYAAANVAAHPSTGAIRANIYNVLDKVQLQYNTSDDSLDFVFI